MIVELIKKEDLSGLTKSFISAFKSEPWCENWKYKVAKKRLENSYNTPGHYGLLVRDKDVIVGGAIGVVKIQPEGYVYELTEFFISEDYQEKGVGSMLYNELLSKLKSKGIIGMLIITLAGSKAHQFYLSQGAYDMKDNILLAQEL